jgi:hypothetical protein
MATGQLVKIGAKRWSAMSGAMSRTKGHTFERLIATHYRARWPGRTVRRGQQGAGAHEPDVVVDGLALWTECECAVNPNPVFKLAQAERDTLRVTVPIYPVVVWRKTHAKSICVTMRLETLMAVTGGGMPHGDTLTLITTVDFIDWLEQVRL